MRRAPQKIFSKILLTVIAIVVGIPGSSFGSEAVDLSKTPQSATTSNFIKDNFEIKNYPQITSARKDIFAGRINLAEDQLIGLTKSNDQYLSIDALVWLATLCRLQKRHQEALVYAEAAAIKADKLNSHPLINAAYRELGAAHRDLGNIEKAGHFLITAKEEIDKLGDSSPELGMSTISAIASLISAKKLNSEEENALNTAKAYGESLCDKHPEMLAEFYIVAADCKSSSNNKQAAADLLQECITLCKKISGIDFFYPIAVQKACRDPRYEEGKIF